MTSTGAAAARALGGRRHRPSRPPGPAGRRWVGNLADYEADRLGFLQRTRLEHGGLVSFDRRTTVVHDVELVSEVLRGRTGDFEVRHDVLQQRLSLAAAAETTALSALLAPQMRRSVAAGITDLLLPAASTRLGELREHGVVFEPVAVFEELISTAVARYYFAGQGPDLLGRSRDLLDGLSLMIGNPLAPPASWPTPGRRRIATQHLALQHAVVSLLEQRLRHPGRFDDLAARVVAAADRRALTVERIADLLIGSLLAGHRVPAAAASWVFLLLADHPAAQESLRDEAAAFTGATSPAGEPPHPAAYPVAHAVVLESLRLYPPTWLITREASVGVRLGGYAFPAGHHFMISPYVVHRDERHFDRPDAFLPQRWAGPAGRRPELMPFGAGRHACPGSHLATTALVSLVLAAVADSRVERDPGVVTPDPRTTLLPHGLRLRLSPWAEADPRR